jgi:hypothetical protein
MNNNNINGHGYGSAGDVGNSNSSNIGGGITSNSSSSSSSSSDAIRALEDQAKRSLEFLLAEVDNCTTGTGASASASASTVPAKDKAAGGKERSNEPNTPGTAPSNTTTASNGGDTPASPSMSGPLHAASTATATATDGIGIGTQPASQCKSSSQQPAAPGQKVLQFGHALQTLMHRDASRVDWRALVLVVLCCIVLQTL